MKSVTIAVVTMLIALVSASAVAQQGSVKKDQLIGSWSLVSVDLELEGKKSQPFGANPKGYMNLDRNGSYSILLFKPGTPGFASKSRMKGTDAEYKSVGLNSQAYFGTYRLNEKDGSMDMRVDQSTFPNHDGTDQKRSLSLSGDLLRINNPLTASGGKAETVWKRIK